MPLLAANRIEGRNKFIHFFPEKHLEIRIAAPKYRPTALQPSRQDCLRK